MVLVPMYSSGTRYIYKYFLQATGEALGRCGLGRACRHIKKASDLTPFPIEREFGIEWSLGQYPEGWMYNIMMYMCVECI